MSRWIALLALCLVPGLARAQARTVSLNFIAFNGDQTLFLVRQDDGAQGVSLQTREMETNKIKKGVYVQDKADEQAQVKKLRHTFKVAGHAEQTDPKGRYTVMGAPDGKHGYNILVMRGARIGVVGTVPLKTDQASGREAKAMLKEVVWTPDGKMILAIVSQKVPLSDGYEETDDVHFFKFKDWKVKWIQPEPGEEGEGGEASPE